MQNDRTGVPFRFIEKNWPRHESIDGKIEKNVKFDGFPPRKAKRTGFHGHHRSLEECDVFHSGGEGSNFQDDAVAKYALAIQAWKQSKLSGAE